MAPGKGCDSNELNAALERITAQGEDNMSEFQKDLLKWARNVDKRYAWVVLAALWFMMAASLGSYRIYGLIYARQIEDGYTREEATWPVSTIFTVENIIGPLVSIIAYHISYRQSMLIGSLLLVLGNGLTAFSSSLVLDVLLIGLVQGIGYAFIFMPFMEIINSYFIKYRNIALGFALCGGTISVFFWTVIFQWLLNNYHWRYAYFGISAVCAISLFMVPLLKPNPKPELNFSEQPLKGKGRLEKQAGHLADRQKLSRNSVRALTYRNSVRQQSVIMIARQTGLQRQASVISVNPFASSAGLERKISRAIDRDNSRRQSEVSQGKAANQQQQQSSAQTSPGATLADFTSALSLSNNPKSEQETMSLTEVGQYTDFDKSIIWDILKTPAFHMIWYNELIYFWIFSIYFLILVDYGVDRGCSKEEADSLLNFQSVGELLGRLVLTILVDMQFMSNKNVVVLVLFLLAGLLVLVTQLSSFLALASITVAISALLSLMYILLNGLLVDNLGERQVTLGYGMASCIGGVLMSFRPQAVGYFRDTLGAYDPLMICLGISCAFGAILWLIEPLMRRCCQGNQANNNIDDDLSQCP